MNWSRRGFCEAAWRSLIAGLVIPASRAWGNTTLAVDHLCGTCGSWSNLRTRTYRADVTISLMGVPIFSRQAAGSASARIREAARDGLRTMSICFAGGSDPKRAHGVNYCGSAEEIAVEESGALVEAASFAFVTASSSDEPFDQARRRVIEGNGKERGRFVAVDELHKASEVRVRKTFTSVPESPCSSWSQLTRHVRSQFTGDGVIEREIAVAAAPSTFLYSMLAGMRSRERNTRQEYFHNGKRYQLDCEKSAHNGLVRLVGRIHDLETRRDTNFKLWMEEGEDLPIRIEFSPRSYLRITLECDAAIRSPFDLKEEM